MKRFRGEYSDDFAEIARACKERADWKCERCGHGNHAASGHVLTVHHLDGNKANDADWNLAALCQRCHLHVQGKVNFAQSWMFDHSDWMKPHVEGFERSNTMKHFEVGSIQGRGI